MTQSEEREIERRLRDRETPGPPADLLDRLKEEIPERPRVLPFEDEAAPTEPAAAKRYGYLIAATIAVAAIGVLLVTPLWSPRSPSPPQAMQISPLERPSTGAGRLSDGPAPRQRPDEDSATRPGEQVAPPAPGSTGASNVSERNARISERRVPVGERALPESSGARRESPGTADRQAQGAADLLTPAPAPEAPMPGRRARELQGLAYMEMEEAVAARPRMISPEPGPAVPPSTGGTTEPNDQPYGDMFFESYGVNPFIDTEDDNLSTFGLDVDTGSFSVARSYVQRGHLPPPAAVRVEEFVNYFDYGDAPPRRGDFAIRLEGAPAPFAEGPRYQLLRVGIRARDVVAAERPPATLIFTVDVSGSMAREDRLGLVKQSLALLLGQLRPDDRVGLVVYGSSGQVLLEPTGDHEAIRTAIDRLRPGGSTNAEQGLVLAYGLVERHFREGGIHRVVLCSDGVANVGRTGPESILARIGAAAENGIELTTVGFGMGNYNDVLMEQLADRGDGSYAYVDTLPEARRVFVQNLTGMLQTVAREAKVQVEFDRDAVERYRLLGYENRDIADEDFRDDSIDAGEIGAGHTATALYEIKLAEDVRPKATLATVRLRYHSVERGEVVETAGTISRRDLASSWDGAEPSLRLAAVVAEFAEILRHSYWAKDGDLGALFAEAQRLSAAFPGDLEVAELVTLIGQAARLEGQRGE